MSAIEHLLPKPAAAPMSLALRQGSKLVGENQDYPIYECDCREYNKRRAEYGWLDGVYLRLPDRHGSSSF